VAQPAHSLHPGGSRGVLDRSIPDGDRLCRQQVAEVAVARSLRRREDAENRPQRTRNRSRGGLRRDVLVSARYFVLNSAEWVLPSVSVTVSR
jgi:hypothetical protein